MNWILIAASLCTGGTPGAARVHADNYCHEAPVETQTPTACDELPAAQAMVVDYCARTSGSPYVMQLFVDGCMWLFTCNLGIVVEPEG